MPWTLTPPGRDTTIVSAQMKLTGGIITNVDGVISMKRGNERLDEIQRSSVVVAPEAKEHASCNLGTSQVTMTGKRNMKKSKRGVSQMALLLADIRAFDKSTLKETETIVTNVLGERHVVHLSRDLKREENVDEEEEQRLKLHAAQKAALLRKLSGRDCCPSAGVACLRLYIGSQGAARNLKALRKRGVTHIVNATAILPCYFEDRFAYLKIPIFDDESTDVYSWFYDVNNFIDEGLKHGGVLVHCCAGQSRSAAFVIAYLMARCHLKLQEALEAVLAVRPCVRPNGGFMRQLREFESVLAVS